MQANNPFVVRFYYSFSSPEKLFLVMEYCPGGDLSSVLQHLGRFDEDVAKQYIAETVLALEYCHSKVGACFVQEVAWAVHMCLFCPRVDLGSTWVLVLLKNWPGQYANAWAAQVLPGQ